MAKKKKKQNYRALKKELNKYHKFSFDMPRKGKDFSPQQKAAITRQFNKLRGVIEGKDKFVTYVPYTKGKKYSSVDGLRTNKGIVINGNKAKIKQDKKTKKYIVQTKIGPMKFDDHVFPEALIYNPDLIDEWVQRLKESYTNRGRKVLGLMWLRHMTSNTNRYSAGMFALYSKENSAEQNKKRGSIIGVQIGYR